MKNEFSTQGMLHAFEARMSSKVYPEAASRRGSLNKDYDSNKGLIF